MEIDRYKLSINRFTSELEEPLNREQRTVVQTEVEIYEVSHPDNNDGSYDEVYKAKVVGATTCSQLGDKVVKGKSKRRNSQKLRQALWSINPEESFYDWFFSKLMVNLEEVIDFLKDK